MKKFLLFIFAIAIISLQCTTEEEEPYFCHLYGYVLAESDSVGVNNLLLRIWHINPDDMDQLVVLDTVRTHTDNSLFGFFERDSVCYGTSQKQGRYVTIVVDSTYNPGWPSQYWTPGIYGEVDTVTLYILD